MGPPATACSSRHRALGTLLRSFFFKLSFGSCQLLEDQLQLVQHCLGSLRFFLGVLDFLQVQHQGSFVLRQLSLKATSFVFCSVSLPSALFTWGVSSYFSALLFCSLAAFFIFILSRAVLTVLFLYWPCSSYSSSPPNRLQVFQGLACNFSQSPLPLHPGPCRRACL